METVIKYVTDQILDGWTEQSSHGYIDCTAQSNPSSAINVARREIAKRSSEIAKKEIEALENALAKAEKMYYEERTK